MTKEEAKEHLLNGEIITHRYFEPNEFVGLKIIEGMRFIYDEKGYLVREKEFWAYRNNDSFEDGWSLFSEKDRECCELCSVQQLIENMRQDEEGCWFCSKCISEALSKP